MRFIFVKLPVLVFLQIRQRQVFKQEIEVFIFGDLEHELVLAFTVLACLALSATASAASTLWSFNTIVLDKVIVTGMHAMTQAAAPLMKHRFVDIFRWNGDRLAALHVGYRTLVDGLGNRLLDLRFITAQKALAVHRAFVFAVQPPVNEIGHISPRLHRCRAEMAAGVPAASALSL